MRSSDDMPAPATIRVFSDMNFCNWHLNVSQSGCVRFRFYKIYIQLYVQKNHVSAVNHATA